MRQKRQIYRENSKYTPDENFVAIFALTKRLPTFAALPDLLLFEEKTKFEIAVAANILKRFPSGRQGLLCEKAEPGDIPKCAEKKTLTLIFCMYSMKSPK